MNLAAAHSEILRISAEIKLAKLNGSLAKSIETERICKRNLERLDILYKGAVLDREHAKMNCHSFYKYLWNVSKNV